MVCLKSCCCGCDLQIGSVLIGIWNLLLSLAVLIVGIWGAEKIKNPNYEVFRYVMIFIACFGGLSASFSVMLVIGAVKKISSLLKAWVNFQFICVISSSTLIIFDLVHSGFGIIDAGILSNTVINIYFMMVVGSYNTELKQLSEWIHSVISIEDDYQPATTDVV